MVCWFTSFVVFLGGEGGGGGVDAGFCLFVWLVGWFLFVKSSQMNNIEQQQLEQQQANAYFVPCGFTTTAATTRSTSIDPPRPTPAIFFFFFFFFFSPATPSLTTSSLCGPRCPPPADRQICEYVLRGSFCRASVPT